MTAVNKLEAGQKAPVFKGLDQEGKMISLEDFLSHKVVLYFYPKDSTPGCTAQACNLRDNYKLLLDKGIKIIGVSADSAKSHQKFIEKNNLPFPLIADTDKTILQQYGVWGPKKFMGKVYDGIHRTTFLIDEQGLIIHIFDKVDTKNHTEQILEKL